MTLDDLPRRIEIVKVHIFELTYKINGIKPKTIAGNPFIGETLKNLRSDRKAYENELNLLYEIEKNPEKIHELNGLLKGADITTTDKKSSKSKRLNVITQPKSLTVSEADKLSKLLKNLGSDIRSLEKTKVHQAEVGFLQNNFFKRLNEFKKLLTKKYTNTLSLEFNKLNHEINSLEQRFIAKIDISNGSTVKSNNLKSNVNANQYDVTKIERKKITILLVKFIDNLSGIITTNKAQIADSEKLYNRILDDIKDKMRLMPEHFTTEESNKIQESVLGILSNTEKIFLKWKKQKIAYLDRNIKRDADFKQTDLPLKMNKSSKSVQTIYNESLKIDNIEAVVSVYWNEIVFGDGLIYFHRPGLGNYVYKTQLSRQSYNHLKSHLKIVSDYRFTFVVNIQTRQVLEVKGIEILGDIFSNLATREIIDMYNIGDIVYFQTKILGGFSNLQIIKTFRLKDRSLYLSYLCDRQEFSFKIIPVREIRSFISNDSMIEEEVFLFSFKVGGKIFIIWESVEESRSTHIFKTTDSSYIEALQRVYDYITTLKVPNKRQLLHQGQLSYFDGPCIYCGSIKHDTWYDWSKRIGQMCK